jgi:hypothetical protein
MRNNAPPLSSPHTQAVAEELAHLLCEGGWHGFEELFAGISETLCPDQNGEPCRELLRLHIFGRLQNWLRHGLLEQRAEEYRAIGADLAALTSHAAAEHCRDLLEKVVTTGKALDSLPKTAC